MTQQELNSIKENIMRIERFEKGYPKLIEHPNPKWAAFFRMQYELCCERVMDLQHQRSLL